MIRWRKCPEEDAGPIFVILSEAKNPLGHHRHPARSRMPPTHRSYWIYIITNRPHGTLYVGVTNSLERRIVQHKSGMQEGFSQRYGLKHLVYFEQFRYACNAIARETELKGWLRRRKIALTETHNPLWRDLAANWFDGIALDSSLRSE